MINLSIHTHKHTYICVRVFVYIYANLYLSFRVSIIYILKEDDPSQVLYTGATKSQTRSIDK